MDWTEIVVAVISGGLGLLGAMLANNKRLAVLEARLEEKLDSIADKLDDHSRRIDAHNHLNDRLTKVEVLLEERSRKP